MGKNDLYQRKSVWKVIDFFAGFLGLLVLTLVSVAVFYTNAATVGVSLCLVLIAAICIFSIVQKRYYIGIGALTLLALVFVGIPMIIFGSCLLGLALS